MAFLTSARVSANQRVAEALAHYVAVKGLSMSAACRVVCVARSWPGKNKGLLDRAMIEARAKPYRKSAS